MLALLQVYIVGEVGIQEELDLKGIRHCGGPADADKKIELKPGYALPHDEDVRCSSPFLCRAWEKYITGDYTDATDVCIG